MGLLPFTEAWMTAPRAAVRVPGPEECRPFIDSIDTTVPYRGQGRRNWHRERFCIAAFLRYACRSAPSLFPAELLRQQSPDFMLVPLALTRALAIEHTDASADEFQDRLDAEATAGIPVAERLPGLGGASAAAWMRDLRSAIDRKNSPQRWRHARVGGARCLLVNELMETFMSIDDAKALAIAKELLADASFGPCWLDAIAVIRGGEVRIWAGPPILDLLAS